MITSEGRIHIKRYLSRVTETIGESIALGVGTSAESLTSNSLDFEVIRADVHIVSYDFLTDRIIFKASIPEEFVGTVYEIGLWSRSVNDRALGFGSRTLSTFDSSEGWTGGFVPAVGNGGRIGQNALLHAPESGDSMTSSLTNVMYDLSGNSSGDQFIFAYNVANANTTSLRFRFLTNGANFYDYNLGPQTGGYKTIRVNKGSATTVGFPDWGSITEIQVTTTSGGGGTSGITFDGIRIEDVDSINPEYVLVARELLSTPFVKTETMNQDVEFSLAVNIT